jgi:hypothetical protein
MSNKHDKPKKMKRGSYEKGLAKIMVLNGGEIEEYASHEELMAAKGFYYSLYMSQFKGKAPAGVEAGTADFVST